MGGGGRGDHPPPLVAENFVCSNSNFSPTGAITKCTTFVFWAVIVSLLVEQCTDQLVCLYVYILHSACMYFSQSTVTSVKSLFCY